MDKTIEIEVLEIIEIEISKEILKNTYSEDKE